MASACPDAVGAGIGVLSAGGNAADAAATVLLASCVTQLGAVCLGGEAAAIVHDARSGASRVLGAQGAAPRNADALALMTFRTRRETGLHLATTPAILDLCVTLLRELGTVTFARAAAPAIALLERGRPATYFDTSLRRQIDAATGAILKTGVDPDGSRAWWLDLKRTFERLADAERRAQGTRAEKLTAVADCFYRGDVAADLAAWYREQGAYLAAHDLEAHRTTIEEPLCADIWGCRVLKPGPWTQGLWLLQALRILDGFDLSAATDAADRCHLTAETIRLCLADRDRHLADPDFVDVPVAALVSDEYLAMRRGLIQSERAIGRPSPGDPAHPGVRLDAASSGAASPMSTIACVAADGAGNMVVITPSGVGSTAGSGGTTGVTHGTRLKAARLEPAHANCLAPGKRPLVTLSPTLVLKSGKPFLGLSVPGGDYQDQAALLLLYDVLHHKRTIDDALARPEESAPLFVDWSAASSSLLVQERLMASVADGLSRRGHAVAPTTLSVKHLAGAMVHVDAATGELVAIGPAAAAC